MKYVAVRGHRGAGKSTVAYLLGCCLEHMKNTGASPDTELFNNWCDRVMADGNVIYNDALQHIYFDTFSDTLLVYVGMMLGIHQQNLRDDYYKDHLVINIANFEMKLHEEIPSDLKLYTAAELYKLNKTKGIDKNDYRCTLREFILYFGYEIMPKYFGTNVWVKILKSNTCTFNFFNEEDAIKIYSDLKTSEEIDYMESIHGIIIKVSRPGHKKRSTCLETECDNRFDYEVVVDKTLYNIKDKIIEISKHILNGDK